MNSVNEGSSTTTEAVELRTMVIGVTGATVRAQQTQRMHVPV
ncbi:MAG TPA: hypothetical protein VKB50_01660 [Vicinamibacterales bacterium]|nr:hypothetical protein [Vicinamibacterales bacterium]